MLGATIGKSEGYGPLVNKGDLWLPVDFNYQVISVQGTIMSGYIFEIDANADGPVPAIPVIQAGRRAHEAAVEAAGIIYTTEDRSITPDPLLGSIGSCFYRYIPNPRGAGYPLAETTGPLQALKLRDEFHANMDIGRIVGKPYKVEWVPVPEPDHDDDTDARLDRVSGFTPNRVQAQDNGAAYFDRLATDSPHFPARRR